jgi:pectate lyase
MKTTITLLLAAALLTGLHAQTPPSFPGAEGFGATATGGRGGQVIYVTNLNIDGPGSLQEALNTNGPRYILFKVSGVIDGAVEIPVGNGNFTLAGQTSPNGIITRGFLAYNNEDATASNFIVRHMRFRMGDLTLHPTGNFLTGDALTLGGVHKAIIDHCSMAHAGDEAVDLSRTSSFSIQNCMFSETLGEHGYLGGMLTNYRSATSNHDSLSIHHNAWNRVGGRMPEFSCESPECNNHTMHAELSCNLFWDQRIETYYNASIDGSGSNETYFLDLNIVNNFSMGRSDYCNPMFNISMLNIANNDFFVSGNKMNLFPSESDYQLFGCCNDFCQTHPNTDMGTATQLGSRHPYPSITYTPTTDIVNYMTLNAGAFPRDVMDTRLIAPLQSGTIDPTAVDVAGADDAFVTSGSNVADTDSDNDGMPDYWETAQGLDPSAPDHNGSDLSVSITGVTGYTNLECYLNCLSDALVNGGSVGTCGIQISRPDPLLARPTLTMFPSPAQREVWLDVQLKQPGLNAEAQVTDVDGRLVRSVAVSTTTTHLRQRIDLEGLGAGVYFVTLSGTTVKFVKTN